MSLIVNDDTGAQSQEGLKAALEAYKQHPYGLLPKAKVTPTRTCYRDDVDHEQVAKHESLLQIARSTFPNYLTEGKWWRCPKCDNTCNWHEDYSSFTYCEICHVMDYWLGPFETKEEAQDYTRPRWPLRLLRFVRGGRWPWARRTG